MNKADEIIAVGKIIGAHGLRGEVRLAPYASLDGAEWNTVYVRTGKADRPVKVVHVRANKELLILELQGFGDRSAAETLAGSELCMKKGDLPELAEDEYYHADLLGAAVFTDDGRDLGRVVEIIPTGGNDVLEVRGPLGTVLIPAIEDVVLEVDMGKARIVVHLLEGLLDGEKG